MVLKMMYFIFINQYKTCVICICDIDCNLNNINNIYIYCFVIIRQLDNYLLFKFNILVNI